jgi:hypothetical protein
MMTILTDYELVRLRAITENHNQLQNELNHKNSM